MKWAMRKKKVPEVMAKAVMSLYDKAKTQVQVRSVLSDECSVNVGVLITKKAMSFLAYWTGSYDDFLLLGRRLCQLFITNSAKHSSQTYRIAGQRCFGLLALISRPQVRHIHLPERMILPDHSSLRINRF